MAAGTPVLASDIPAHHELLGGTGTLLPVADADAWAVRSPCWAHPRHRPSRAARERARTYTWRRTAQAHAELWRTVLS
jgi:glycosyltransferase involved in cell wall biosynthesis